MVIWCWKELLKQLKMRQRNKRGFLGMLLGTLGASLLENMSPGKGMLRAGHGRGMLRADYGNKMDF